MAALGLSACGGDADSLGGNGSGGPTGRAVKTDNGDISVPAQAKRVVCTSSVIAGYLFAFGAPVVATDTTVPPGIKLSMAGFPRLWSADAEARGTAKLPGGEQLDIEAVAAQQPDLIIGGGQAYSPSGHMASFPRSHRPCWFRVR